MVLRDVSLAALLVLMGCGGPTEPHLDATDATSEEARRDARGRARAGVFRVVRAAYQFMVEHPERKEATLDEIVAPGQEPDFIFAPAREAQIDPWGSPIRLTFRSPLVIVATSSGPDGTFGTADDLSDSTHGWQ